MKLISLSEVLGKQGREKRAVCRVRDQKEALGLIRQSGPCALLLRPEESTNAFLEQVKKENAGCRTILMMEGESREMAVLCQAQNMVDGIYLASERAGAGKRKKKVLSSSDLFRDILSMEYVHDLIYGHLERLSELRPVFGLLGFELEPDIVLTAVIDNFWTICENRDNSHRYRLKRLLLNQTRAVMSRGMKGVATTLIGTDKVVILLDCGGRTGEAAENYAESCAEQIRAETGQATGFSVSVGVSDYCPNKALMWKAYEQSFRALESSFQAGNGRVLRYKRPETAAAESGRPEQEQIKRQLIIAVSTQDERACGEALARFMSSLSLLNISESYVKSRCVILLSDIAKYAMRLGLDSEKLSEKIILIVNQIFKAGTMEEMQREMLCFLLELSERLRSGRDVGKDIMDVARAYIQQYFADDLTLQGMADLCGYSTAHFSRCFKERFNIKFVQFLMQVRLENAKHLLGNSDRGIAEISEKSGFRNLSYFSSAFKRETGMTPNQYRLAAGREEKDALGHDVKAEMERESGIET